MSRTRNSRRSRSCSRLNSQDRKSPNVRNATMAWSESHSDLRFHGNNEALRVFTIRPKSISAISSDSMKNDYGKSATDFKSEQLQNKNTKAAPETPPIKKKKSPQRKKKSPSHEKKKPNNLAFRRKQEFSLPRISITSESDDDVITREDLRGYGQRVSRSVYFCCPRDTRAQYGTSFYDIIFDVSQQFSVSSTMQGTEQSVRTLYRKVGDSSVLVFFLTGCCLNDEQSTSELRAARSLNIPIIFVKRPGYKPVCPLPNISPSIPQRLSIDTSITDVSPGGNSSTSLPKEIQIGKKCLVRTHSDTSTKRNTVPSQCNDNITSLVLEGQASALVYDKLHHKSNIQSLIKEIGKQIEWQEELYEAEAQSQLFVPSSEFLNDGASSGYESTSPQSAMLSRYSTNDVDQLSPSFHQMTMASRKSSYTDDEGPRSPTPLPMTLESLPGESNDHVKTNRVSISKLNPHLKIPQIRNRNITKWDEPEPFYNETHTTGNVFDDESDRGGLFDETIFKFDDDEHLIDNRPESPVERETCYLVYPNKKHSTSSEPKLVKWPLSGNATPDGDMCSPSSGSPLSFKDVDLSKNCNISLSTHSSLSDPQM